MKLPTPAIKLCQRLLELNSSPIIVGGYVRDFFMDRNSKDIDIEVYGIDSLEKLSSALKVFGNIYMVGKSFGVLKLSFDGYDFDISLPRTEIKTAKGHKGFKVITDGYLSFKEAASRRDFTINAIGYDFKEKCFLDPYEGKADISNKIIKHVKDDSFIEDPLRVLRAVQFAARFNFKLHTNTLKLCRNMVKDGMLKELPKERLFEEYKKLLLKADRPSVGFTLLDDMDALFPELKSLQGIEQDTVSHPEGDVWTHTMMSLDAMAELKTGDNKKDLILMLATLCHDLGKAKATKDIYGKISYTGHENILEPSICLIERLSDEKALIEEIIPLVQEHLKPSQLYKQKSNDSTIRRLSTRVNIEDLVILATADNFGRTTEDAKNRRYPAGEWLLQRAKELNVQNERPKPFLQGRDLIDYGMKPSDEFKKILDAAYDNQLDGLINSHKEAILWMKTYLL